MGIKLRPGRATSLFPQYWVNHIFHTREYYGWYVDIPPELHAAIAGGFSEVAGTRACDVGLRM